MLLLALAVATAAGRIAPSALAADPVLIAAGDIASCSSTGARATAALLDALPGTVVTLGDNAYQSGTAAEFATTRHGAAAVPIRGLRPETTTM